MRHGKKFNHLGRKKGHRRAMLANMASSLIMHKRIKTTVAKAKALRKYVEPLLTRSKNDTTHNRRVVFSHLQDKETIKELFGDVSTKIADRPGGYTRILKIGSRLGDGAEMCIIELVDYNADMMKAPGSSSESKKRTRRGRKKKSTNTDTDKAAAVATAETVTEAVEAEAETVTEAVEEQQAEVENVVEEQVEQAEETAQDAAEDASSEEE